MLHISNDYEERGFYLSLPAVKNAGMGRKVKV